jgi:predicted metal-dependent phosphoesterase TrpH
MIDLHIHSTASDGTLHPHEIIGQAVGLGLEAIAITDHDSVAGVKTARRLVIPPSLKFLTGVEISAAPPPTIRPTGSFHILGYGIDPEDPNLNDSLRVLQEARESRNPAIIGALNRLGVDITLAEVVAAVGECQLGRPHIARRLVQKKVVASIDEAFDRFLGRGKPAYIDKYRIGCRDALELIRIAGGVPVLAHPGLLAFETDSGLADAIATLVGMGLMGLEVFYPEHTPAFTEACRHLALQHGLLMTGGTDFHGALNPEIQMGTGRGDLDIPFALYEALVRRVRQTA